MHLLTVFVSFICVVHCGDQIYVNKLFDNQLLAIGNALRKMHVKYIQIGDVTVSDNIKATNVRLGDITRIVRKGDALFWTDEDTLSNQGAVGIDKLDLLMDTLEFGGKKYSKVLIVVYSNMLSFKSDLYSTKTQCNQTYSGLKLSRVQGVMLYSRPTVKLNITNPFIKQVVPFINRKLSSPAIHRIIEKYLDSCSAHSTEDVLDFLTKDQSTNSIQIDDSSASVNELNEEEENLDDIPAFLRKLVETSGFKSVFAVE